ncbi:MAG: FxsA family protein [Proteobacteria bacterium]|jgi:UPF0716 protein FxsA|nr:FxsA family protein [Pseudomonadota bacterium]
MRFLILAIVLAFPAADVMITVRLARWTGVPLWIWLTGSALAGMYVLTNERNEFRMRTLAAFRGHENPLRALLDSGRRVLAGILLIVPGVVSDALALLLLALPINLHGRLEPQPVAAGRAGARRRGSTVDGDFRRLD